MRCLATRRSGIRRDVAFRPPPVFRVVDPSCRAGTAVVRSPHRMRTRVLKLGVRLYVWTGVLQDNAVDAGIEARHRPVWALCEHLSPNKQHYWLDFECPRAFSVGLRRLRPSVRLALGQHRHPNATLACEASMRDGHRGRQERLQKEQDHRRRFNERLARRHAEMSGQLPFTAEAHRRRAENTNIAVLPVYQGSETASGIPVATDCSGGL